MWNDIWTGLTWFAKSCFVFAILAILLLPVLYMTDLGAMKLVIPAGLSDSWVALVLLALSLFLIYLVWRLLRALLLRPFGSWGVFGASTGARLLALGITALFLPRAVERLVLLPPTILFRMVENLGRRATGFSVTASARSNDTVVNIQEPVLRLAAAIPEILSETARILTQAFDGVLTADMVVAIALWLLIGNLLSAAARDGGASVAGLSGNRLSHYVASMSAAQRHGLVLTAVFLAGAYLSIAAIVAIPWLHEEKVSPGLTQESLVKILDRILPAASTLEAAEKGETAARADPLAPLSAYLGDKTKAEQLAPETVTALESAIRDARDTRAYAHLRLQQLPGEIAQRVGQMRQAAMNAFELETATPMSNQERGFFMRQIEQTITNDYRRLEYARTQCAAVLSGFDRQLRDTGEILIQVLDLQSADPQIKASQRSREQEAIIVRAMTSEARAADSSLRNACDTLDFQGSVYTAPVAGAGWGPFGAVARWLLQTKSVALALITGMLGFGLLGAAIATFVRGGQQRGKVSLTAEVTSVLIRGLSAAVVVFLAVKGGLAVFSTGDAEPNAYVVFLTCLVGAVFSEDVWTWARTRFLDSFRQDAEQPVRKETMAETIEETLAERGDPSESRQPPAPPASAQAREPGQA
ncbi:hypothetical protein [Massilia niastensis]|uniref:hypothetical protein n=1 Tax=Massilia niastensis TaxID=544911 RepID=UPI00038106FF|nr:hypothetical protein [Massilia niastensis]